jgi:hypothetical protein
MPVSFAVEWISRPAARLAEDAEKVRQRRSRFAQRLPVPNRVRIASSLAAALLDDLFEHPAGVFSSCP